MKRNLSNLNRQHITKLMKKEGRGKAKAPPVPVFSARLHMQYIGVLTLLGRLTRLSADDRESVARAMEDGNAYLASIGSTMRYRRAAAGGWAAFDPAD